MVAAFSRLSASQRHIPLFMGGGDVIDMSTEQMCGGAVIHDVTQHSVTLSDILSSERSLPAPGRERVQER